MNNLSPLPLTPEPAQVAAPNASKSIELRPGTLHVLCGRIAAGKSTLAKTLARQHKAVLFSEDAQLSTLYGDLIASFSDYLDYAKRLRQLIAPMTIDLLSQGQNVVLDFQANTPKSRQWFQGIYKEAKARHRLHYVTTSTETCRLRLAQRVKESGEKANAIALNEFDAVNRRFVAPEVNEGFNVEIYR